MGSSGILPSQNLVSSFTQSHFTRTKELVISPLMIWPFEWPAISRDRAPFISPSDASTNDTQRLLLSRAVQIAKNVTDECF